MRARSLLPAVAFAVGLPLGTAAAPAPVRVTDARLNYVAYTHGIPILRFQVNLATWPGGYRMSLGYGTIGLVGFFYRGHQMDEVAGGWKDGRPAPRTFRADGVWHGGVHHLRMTYRDDMPSLRAVVPPIRRERHKVPAADQVGTVDTLTAVVDLLRRLAVSGSCMDSVRTFDGRRLGVIVAQDAGDAALPRTARSIFAGPARRCDFTGRMLEGFLYGHRQRDSRPLHGAAWFAALEPGGAKLPVHLRFDTDWFGEVTMYLTHADLGADALTATRSTRHGKEAAPH